MTTIRILSAAQVAQALPMGEAIAGMKLAYRQHSLGRADAPLRARVEVPEVDGLALFMPAYLPPEQGEGSLAVKVVSVFPQNAAAGEPIIYASVLVLDEGSGRPLALLEGGSLTAIRTAAGAGAATDLLAPPEASVLAMFGAGVQARSGIEAMCSVRPIETIRIYSRTRTKAESLAAEVAGQGNIPNRIEIVDTPDLAVADADIVYAATTASQPVFDGQKLKPGAHINGVGSYTPQMQEIDSYSVQNAEIFVDSLEAIMAEAGDLLVPLQAGEISPADICGEIGAVAAGALPGRRGTKPFTFFKSVGIAAQDAVAARLTLRNAMRLGLGTAVPFT